MTLRARLSLLVVGAVAVGLFLIGATTYAFVARRVHRDVDTALEDRARSVIDQTVSRPVSDVVLLPNVDSLVDATTFIQVVDVDGGVQARSENLGRVRLPVDQATLAVARGDGVRYRTVSVTGARLRMIEAPLALRRSARAPIGVVQVARDVAAAEDGLRRLRSILVLGGAGTLFVAGGAALLLTRAALRPLAAMQASAEAVAATGDPARRGPTPGRGGEEITRLGAAFDQMLERLQASGSALQAALDSQRRFVADASHELRTPITSARGNLEVVLRNPEMAPTERRQAVEETLTEMERMARLVDGLLTLARADAGALPPPEPVALGDVLEQAHERAIRRAADRRLTIDNRLGTVTVVGWADALHRMLDNIYDNAVKYGEEGGNISAAAHTADGWAWIAITDDGKGIPQEEIPRIFERFYRSPAARGREGSGLGLAIVQQVAAMHAGSVDVARPAVRGTTFTVGLPLGMAHGGGTFPDRKIASPAEPL